MILRAVLASAFVLGLAACIYDWSVAPATVTCRSDADCTSPDYCRFPDHACGKGGPGTCASPVAVASCTDVALDIVCTCSGRVVKSLCQASSFSADLAVDGRCAADYQPGETTCGFRVCEKGTRCVTAQADGGTDYRCER